MFGGTHPQQGRSAGPGPPLRRPVVPGVRHLRADLHAGRLRRAGDQRAGRDRRRPRQRRSHQAQPHVLRVELARAECVRPLPPRGRPRAVQRDVPLRVRARRVRRPGRLPAGRRVRRRHRRAGRARRGHRCLLEPAAGGDGVPGLAPRRPSPAPHGRSVGCRHPRGRHRRDLVPRCGAGSVDSPLRRGRVLGRQRDLLGQHATHRCTDGQSRVVRTGQPGRDRVRGTELQRRQQHVRDRRLQPHVAARSRQRRYPVDEGDPGNCRPAVQRERRARNRRQRALHTSRRFGRRSRCECGHLEPGSVRGRDGVRPPGFQGSSATFGPGVVGPADLGGLHDEISSLVVGPGLVARVCSESQGSGDCETFTGWRSFVGTALADRISWLHVWRPVRFEPLPQRL
jgi:hypothetical protein